MRFMEIHLVENPKLYPAPIDRTGLGTAELSRIVKKGRLEKNKMIRDEILSNLVSNISTDEDKLLSAFDQEIEKLSEEQNEWSGNAAPIFFPFSSSHGNDGFFHLQKASFSQKEIFSMLKHY